MAWWKRDKHDASASPPAPPNVPSQSAEPERYQGRPLLVILENYVLDTIGCLSADKQQGIRSVVQKAFGGGADWKATVRQRLHLAATIDSSFIGMWNRNQEIAEQAGQTLHPIQFAKMVVDKNFAALIGPPAGR